MGRGFVSDIFSHVVAPVRGAEDPALARPAASASSAAEPLTRLAGIGLDERVDEVPVVAVDVDADPAFLALRETLGEFGPVLAAVHRPVEAAAGPAAVEPPPGPLPLVHGGEDGVGVGGIHREVDRARVLVDVEDLLPGIPAVAGPEHAPVLVRPPQVADRRHVDDIGIPRMDEDAGDVLRPLEPLVHPRLAAVRRLVDTVPPRRGLAVLGLARPDPDKVGVGLMKGHIADRTRRLVVEERGPRGAVVLRLPHTGGGRAQIEDLWFGLDDGDVGDPSPHEGGADLPVLEMGDGRLERGLRGDGRGAQEETGR